MSTSRRPLPTTTFVDRSTTHHVEITIDPLSDVNIEDTVVVFVNLGIDPETGRMTRKSFTLSGPAHRAVVANAQSILY